MPLIAANFVFTGTMDYPPNVDAVIWFAQDILAHHSQIHCRARSFILSAPVPRRRSRRWHAITGVFVTGRVADVRPYVAHATACVAPMRIARGIQNKVLEAMAMGRPTVVTADALEGIHAVPGTDLLLANGVEEFAHSLSSPVRNRTPPRSAWQRPPAGARLCLAAAAEKFDAFLNERKNAPVL